MGKGSQKLIQGIKSSYIYWKTGCQLWKQDFYNELYIMLQKPLLTKLSGSPDSGFLVNPWFSESLDFFFFLFFFLCVCVLFTPFYLLWPIPTGRHFSESMLFDGLHCIPRTIKSPYSHSNWTATRFIPRGYWDC